MSLFGGLKYGLWVIYRDGDEIKKEEIRTYDLNAAEILNNLITFIDGKDVIDIICGWPVKIEKTDDGDYLVSFSSDIFKFDRVDLYPGVTRVHEKSDIFVFSKKLFDRITSSG